MHLAKLAEFFTLIMNALQAILFADGIAGLFIYCIKINLCVSSNIAFKILLLHDKVCYLRYRMPLGSGHLIGSMLSGKELNFKSSQNLQIQSLKENFQKRDMAK